MSINFTFINFSLFLLFHIKELLGTWVCGFQVCATSMSTLPHQKQRGTVVFLSLLGRRTHHFVYKKFNIILTSELFKKKKKKEKSQV